MKKKVLRCMMIGFIFSCFASVFAVDLFQQHPNFLNFCLKKPFLNLIGSASMQELCDNLILDFKKNNPNICVVKSGSGSGEAPTAVIRNIAQIGDVSRDLLVSEYPNKFTKKTIAVDGIVVVLNKNNTIDNLTIEQLHKIFTGKIKNWKEVGGQNEPIIVVGREAQSGIRSKLDEFLKTGKGLMHTIELTSDGAVKAKIQKEKNSIGYVSLSCCDKTIKKISINSVKPTIQNIINKNYGLYRTFDQIFLKNRNDELVAAWFSFLETEKARNTIRKLKLIPVI